MRVGWSGVDRYTSDCILGSVQLCDVECVDEGEGGSGWSEDEEKK